MAILQAVRADSIVDAIGVNVHAAFGAPGRAGATYTWNQTDWVQLVSWLGVRHVRDQMWTPSVSGASGSAILKAALALQAAGIGVLRSITGPDKLAELMAGEVPPPEAVETYNERDSSNPSTYIADITSFQPTLYNTVKAAWPNVKVGGPSLIPANYANMPDMSAYADFNNYHSYPRPAQTIEYVPSLANSNIQNYKTVAPAKPIWFTEFGFAHGDGFDPSVETNEFTAAKLLLRTILYQIAPPSTTTINCYPKFTGTGGMGVERAYVYSLLDDHYGQANSRGLEDRYGLFNPDLSPKLSAYVIRTLTQLLGEKNAPAFTPGTLSVSYTGLSGTLMNQFVAQQSDGTMWWMIWQPTPVSNFGTGGGGQPAAGPDLYDAGVPIAASFGLSWPSIAVYRPLVSSSPIQMASGTKLSMIAYNDVQLVRLSATRPGAVARHQSSGLRPHFDTLPRSRG